jgi:hypothetical protein
MNNLHKEINFELEICDHLAAHGWLAAVLVVSERNIPVDDSKRSN